MKVFCLAIGIYVVLLEADGQMDARMPSRSFIL